MVHGWHGWLGTINGVVLLTVLAFPLAVLVVWALARRRGAAGRPHPWRRSLAEVGIVYGTVPWVWMILLPNAGAGADHHRTNLIPLRDLAAVVADGWVSATVQIVGNLLVFAAFGFFAPLRFPALASVWRILALGTAGSIVVESLQFLLHLDRVSSVDDVLLNAAGAALAACASRPWWRPAAAPAPLSAARAR